MGTRILRSAACLALVLGLTAQVARCEEGADRYAELIREATAGIFRGVSGPSEEEQQKAERAMSRLAEHKHEVTRYIISQLKQAGAAKVSAPADSRAELRGLDAGHYGHVLWRFGVEHVLALEPEVLQADSVRIRSDGVRILGMDGKDEPRVAALLVDVLRHDPSPTVQAEAINALDNCRAVERHAALIPFLQSTHTEVRRAAVGFFWSHNVPEARPALEALLEAESDREVCFLLAQTLVKYDGTDWQSLLASAKPGVRQGVLFSLERGYLRGREADWQVALPMIESEQDPRCRAQLAFLLARKGEPRCIPLLIEVLEWEKDRAAVDGGGLPADAAGRLANVTDLPFQVSTFQVSNADHQAAREQGANLYQRVARLYKGWWQENSGRIHWDKTRSKFLVEDKPE